MAKSRIKSRSASLSIKRLRDLASKYPITVDPSKPVGQRGKRVELVYKELMQFISFVESSRPSLGGRPTKEGNK